MSEDLLRKQMRWTADHQRDLMIFFGTGGYRAMQERIAKMVSRPAIWTDPRYQQDGEFERAGASKRHRARKLARQIIALVQGASATTDEQG